MAHPVMFDEHDPVLGRVRAIAYKFPGTSEKVSHGRPVFYTKKIFAYFGGSVRENGRWIEHGHSVLVGVQSDERIALLEDRRFFVPAYLGPSGWIGIDLDKKTDWDEVAELLDASYRLTAPAKLVAQLR